MNDGNIPVITCNIDVKKRYILGVQYGIQGTPALLLEPNYGLSHPERAIGDCRQASGDQSGDKWLI